MRRKKRELKLSNERKSRIKRRLHEVNSKLEQSLDTLAKQNELIKFLEKLKDKSTVVDEQIEKIINDLTHTKILTNDDWRGFKSMFIEAYPNFMNSVLKINPETSEAELRMACMLRLNLSNEEIGNMLGISKDSARKTSLRLRERLHMPKSSHEDLVNFLFSLEA